MLLDSQLGLLINLHVLYKSLSVGGFNIDFAENRNRGVLKFFGKYF